MLTKELQAEILGALPDPVFVMTQSGRHVDMYGGLDVSYYHHSRSLLGKSIHDIFPKEKADRLIGYIQKALRDQSLIVVEYEFGEEDVRRMGGTEEPGGALWFEARIQPLPGLFLGEPAVLWVASNITRRHQLEMRLRHLSDTDELTGLFNRRKLMSTLAASFEDFLRYQGETSLLIFDIDHFKEINDTQGHLAGDEAIKVVADVCKGVSRKTDLIARLGGDEFVILMPHTEPDQALQLTERLRAAFEEQQAAYRCGTISCGVSNMRMTDTSMNDILKRADDALYEAKSQGRNQVRQL